MSYHTPGGWIQAFNQAMAHGRYKGSVVVHICTDHPDCVLVTVSGQRHHVLWKETDPAHAVTLVLK